MECHPVLGRSVVANDAGSNLDIYTRTIVLWGINLTINTERLFQNVVVLGPANRLVWSGERANPRTGGRRSHRIPLNPTANPTRAAGGAASSPVKPIVRMVSNSTHRRGYLPKRFQTVPFRSVL